MTRAKREKPRALNGPKGSSTTSEMKRLEERIAQFQDSVSMSILPSRRPFTVAEYDQMVEMGILRDDDRVELIEGEIVAMSPIGSRHAGCVRRLTKVLSRLLADKTEVSVQCPVAILDWSEPNPDVALLVPRDDDYADAHPVPRQVQVLIEVSDSSLAYDKQVGTALRKGRNSRVLDRRSQGQTNRRLHSAALRTILRRPCAWSTRPLHQPAFSRR